MPELSRQRRVDGQLQLPEGVPGPVVVQLPLHLQQQIPVRACGFDLHKVPFFLVVCVPRYRVPRFSSHYKETAHSFLSESHPAAKSSHFSACIGTCGGVS